MYRALLPRSTRPAALRQTLSRRWNTTTTSTAPASTAQVVSSLRSKLQLSLKESMKAKDTQRTTVIRSVLADVLNAEKAAKSNTSADGEVIRALQQGISRREEAITQYVAASRTDLVDSTRSEIDILRSLLPPQLSEAEVDARIRAVLEGLEKEGERERVNLGVVMRRFWEGTRREEVSPALVSERVKRALQAGAGAA